MLAQVATPWEPEEFLEQSLRLQHPFDEQAAIRDRSRIAVFKLLTEGPSATKQRRASQFKHWQQRAKALDAAEVALKQAAPESVRDCWAGKRTLLFEEMMLAAGISDPGLVTSYLRNGAPVTGEVPASSLFEKREVEPTKTLAEVLQAGAWAKQALKATIRKHSDPAVDREVFDRSLEEVAEGKADGATDGARSRRHLREILDPSAPGRPSPTSRRQAN